MHRPTSCLHHILTKSDQVQVFQVHRTAVDSHPGLPQHWQLQPLCILILTELNIYMAATIQFYIYTSLKCLSVCVQTNLMKSIAKRVYILNRNDSQNSLTAILQLLHPFNGLFVQDNLGTPAPER